MPTTIILADDHPLLLNGTKEFLEKRLYRVIDTAFDGNVAYNKIVAQQPNIAILDFDMPVLNGLEVAQQIYKHGLPVKVVILTLHKQESILKEVGNTIQGYITKDSTMDELEQCITTLNNGGTYIGKKLKNTIQFDSSSNSNIEKLSATELKILKNLNENHSSSQIAESLFISKRTVEKHRSNIIKKLEIGTTQQNALFMWLKQHPNIFDT